MMPIVVAIIAIVVIAGIAVYFLFIKKKQQE